MDLPLHFGSDVDSCVGLHYTKNHYFLSTFNVYVILCDESECDCDITAYSRFVTNM